MRQPSGISGIKGLIVAFFLLALAAHNASAQEIELWSYGQELEKDKVQEALMHAVDWSSLTGDIFKDPYIPVILYPREGEPLDNFSLAFDPNLAVDLLKDAGYSGAGEGEALLQFALLYVSDFDLALLAGAVADNLGQLNIEVTPFEASDEDELYETEVYLANEGDLNALVLQFVE